MNRTSFYCPSCEAFANQSWGDLYILAGSFVPFEPWSRSVCAACHQPAVWRAATMVHPPKRIGPPPASDMPADVVAIYEEARDVSGTSPKSAVALLRLALQVLVDDIERGPGTINDKIGALVKRGLDPRVQQAMDVLRVVGNNAVHPGQIDLEADTDLVPGLFNLLNLIVEQVITRPKHVDSLFSGLPQGAQDAIKKRDTGQATT